MERKKFKHYIYIFTVIFFTTLLAISAIFIAIMHSSYGQQKVKSFAIYLAEKNGVGLKIGSIRGNFPFQFTVKGSEIVLPNKQEVKIDSVSFRPSFFSLLFNELKFRRLDAKGVYISPLPKALPFQEKITTEITGLTLPFNLLFKSITLSDVHFYDLVFDITGKAFLKKRLNYFTADLTFSQKEVKNSNLRFIAYGDKKRDLVETEIKINAASISFFKPFIESNKKAKIVLNLSSTGSWKSFEGLLFHNIKDNKILTKGKIYGHVYPEIFNRYNLDGLNLELFFELSNDLSCNIENIFIENNFIGIFGRSTFEKDLALRRLDLSFETKSLSLFEPVAKTPLEGTFHGFVRGAGDGASIQYKGENLKIGKYPFSAFEGSLFAKKEEGAIAGHISSNIVTLGESISFFTSASYRFDGIIDLKHISLSAPSFDVSSDLQITPDFLFLGYTQANFNNLNILKDFFPKLDFNATVGASLHLFAEDGKQSFDSLLYFYDYHIEDLLGEKIDLDIKAQDIFNKAKFKFHAQAKNMRLEQLKIESLDFITSNHEENNKYELSLQGKWRNPLEIKSEGSWRSAEEMVQINIGSISGVFINQPYSLPSPAQVQFGKDYFSLKNFEISMPSSSVHANIFLSPQMSDIKIVADHFPIDFLSFNPLEVSVFGFASAEMSLEEKGGKTRGSLSMNLDSLTIASLADEKPINAKGYFSGSIENSRFMAKGKIEDLDKASYLEIDTKLPIELSLSPFNFKLMKEKELSAEIVLKGSIEEVLDFINIGNQRIEGDAECALSISDTFNSPHIKGTGKIEKGFYENYVTGTALSDIRCEFISNDHEIVIKSFSASGQKQGKLSATGTIDLRQSQNYPFNLDLHLDNIIIFQTALVTASFEGNLKINGDKKEAFALGEIEVTHAELTIPEKIPSPMPEMDVKFVNKAESTPKLIIEKKPPYPINLNVVLKSSDNIFIKGKGVEARLKGEVALKGTNIDMLPVGKLVLVKGNYLFAGKNFDLSESTLIFTGKPKEFPLLSLGAKTLEKGVLITALLQGPLNAPLLSFTSSPPLPISSIISLLIFGHDLSGISALQALQVATMVAALSEGGGILETTKRNLGIDRLAIVSKSGETPEDPDQIAVEVGKYITRGLLVSYKQGVEDGMSNASAEIDVGWGFIFQIETIREEEQTRATIKWSHNF